MDRRTHNIIAETTTLALKLAVTISQGFLTLDYFIFVGVTCISKVLIYRIYFRVKSILKFENGFNG